MGESWWRSKGELVRNFLYTTITAVYKIASLLPRAANPLIPLLSVGYDFSHLFGPACCEVDLVHDHTPPRELTNDALHLILGLVVYVFLLVVYWLRSNLQESSDFGW